MKIRKSTLICWIVIGMLLTISFVALFYNPMKKIDKIPKDDDIVTELFTDDIEGMNSCEMDADGNISIIGPDAYIVFKPICNEERTIAVQLAKPASYNINAQIYVDYGNGFNENDSFVSSCNKGAEFICFNVREDEYSRIRVDIDSDYSFKSVSMHEGRPDEVFSQQEGIVSRILLAVVCSAISIGILLWLNFRYKFVELIVEKIKICHHRIIRILIALFIFLMLFYLLPINKSLFIFIYAIALVLLVFIMNVKTLKEKPEFAFAEILFIVGVAIVLLQPYGLTCWDTDSHYRWAISGSSIDDVYMTDEDSKILSNNMDYVDIRDTGVENAQKVSEAKENGKYASGSIPNSFSVPHFFNGLAIAILRLFNVNFYWRFVLGKIPSLMIYTVLCYFAMKKLKSGKMILATIALFPTCVFLAGNYSYDYWVTGCSMLGMAYFIANCQEKQAYISDKDTIIIAVSMAMACLPKLIYIGLLLIPFFMPKKKIENKKKFYLINISILACLFVMLMIRTIGQTTGTGDLRGGSSINPSDQILFILSDILGYIVVLVRFLLQYLSISGMQGYITNFAYLGIASGYMIFVVLLAVTTLVDKSECDVDAFSVKSRLYVIVMFLGEAALIATAFYLVFTGVGADTVLGCQPRYIVPLIYPLVAILCGKGIQIKFNRAWFNGIVLAVCASVLFYDIYSMMLVRVM